MASYHFELKSGKKGAAKQHSEYITRQGKFADRKDLLASGYGNMPAEADDDPSVYWRNADLHERANGAAYREAIIALPNELGAAQQREFLAKVIPELVGNRPYQWAIHGPEGKLGGIRNAHVHLMFSDREPDGVSRPIEQVFRHYNREHPDKAVGERPVADARACSCATS